MTEHNTYRGTQPETDAVDDPLAVEYRNQTDRISRLRKTALQRSIGAQTLVENATYHRDISPKGVRKLEENAQNNGIVADNLGKLASGDYQIPKH